MHGLVRSSWNPVILTHHFLKNLPINVFGFYWIMDIKKYDWELKVGGVVMLVTCVLWVTWPPQNHTATGVILKYSSNGV